MTPKDFRAELGKLMPGYRWTVHRQEAEGYLAATGVQSAGSNRLSTLSVQWRENQSLPYCVRAAGYGLRAAWVGLEAGATLAQALRALQDQYERRARLYAGLAGRLDAGRRCSPGRAEA